MDASGRKKTEMMRGVYNLVCNVHSSSNAVVVFCFLFPLKLYTLCSGDCWNSEASTGPTKHT